MHFVILIFILSIANLAHPLHAKIASVIGDPKSGEIFFEINQNTKNYPADRWVKVRFDANINGDLPWSLKPKEKTMRVQPGKFYEAIYIVQNKFNTDITGQAVPSVSPSVASLYFKKSECFCFVNQLLKAGEKQEMLVRFEVDKDLPENVDALTLSYTFFKVKSDT